MKKYFLIAFGITSGLVLSLAILGGGIYWWAEVRTPAPPNITVELDGFPDAKKNEDGKQQPLVRIVITNHDNSKLSINDAYLYITRASDGARTDFRFDVEGMVIYPKEKYVDVVEVMVVKNEWLDHKDSEEFESKEDYLAYRGKWLSQLKKAFLGFNLSFVSDTHNIRILLNVQDKIEEIENKDGWVKDEQ